MRASTGILDGLEYWTAMNAKTHAAPVALALADEQVSRITGVLVGMPSQPQPVPGTLAHVPRAPPFLRFLGPVLH